MQADVLGKADVRSGSLADQAGALAVVLQEEFGVAFRFFDAASGAPLGPKPEGGSPASPPPCLDVVADGRVRVVRLAEGGLQLALLAYRSGQPALVAVGVLPALTRAEPEASRERARLQGWGQAVADRLRLADQLGARRRQEEDRAAQAAAPWEALLTLDQVARRLRIHKQTEKGQQRLLEAAFGLLGAQTLAWVPLPPDQPVFVQGKACLAPADYRQLTGFLARSPDFRPPAPLLCDTCQAQTWGPRYPSLVNLLAFQVTDQGPLGWVVAINKQRIEDRGARIEDGNSRSALLDPQSSICPFRKSDAALLTPFVALLEMHARGTARYQDLKDLLVGLTRSLTTALDAKDSFTYGHSERVARIAVELGREMGLDGDELGDVYLAGLLHDVGKIGIRDTVLLKPDVLTPEEEEHIRKHVTIGYTILADLRQIRSLLPGVLYHHERWDGSGYPDGLAGETIPLLARILAVADGYDAMSNARPYRNALPCRQVEEVLVQGMGTQWDRQVVEAFLRCRQRIHSIRQRGVGDSLRLAIEGTLRSESCQLQRTVPPMVSSEQTVVCSQTTADHGLLTTDPGRTSEDPCR
jgi:HD-GYP domain-containing protein (c-di-GMP phosphodiesterase class II)